MSDNPFDDRSALEKAEEATRPEVKNALELAAEREALAEEHGLAQQKLMQLEATADAVADELASLEDSRPDYELLESACAAVDTLTERGIGELFWGEAHNGTEAEAQLGRARERIEQFDAEIRRLEQAHQQALDAIYGQQGTLELADYELYQALQAEESRQREWIVEREGQPPKRLLTMPWARGFEDDKRFQKTLAGAIAAALLLGIIIPLIDLPLLDRDELVEVPERFAQLIREEPPAPPPPPPPPQRQERPEEVEPEVVPENTVEPVPEPTRATEAKPQSTRDKVNQVGILAFRNNFSSLSESRPAAKLGAEARVTDAGEDAVVSTQRAMVAAQGTGSSGGINLASLSRDISGGEGGVVEGVALTRVESAIDGGGTDDRPRAASAVAGRTDEEIQIVFDRYKASLYRLYNRELRKDPTLRGQMVLQLTIEPDGSVSLCDLQASDMKAPNLAQRVVDSVRAFQFGPKDVPAITILYPIDFLPTA